MAHQSGLTDRSAATVASYANSRDYSERVEEACEITNSRQGHTVHGLRERSARLRDCGVKVVCVAKFEGRHFGVIILR